jgi:hypothetical protein
MPVFSLKNTFIKAKYAIMKGLLFSWKTGRMVKKEGIGKRLFFYFSHMSFSAYLWGIRLLTLLASAAWIGIIFAIDPEHGGMAGRALFFVSFFAMLLGVLTLSVTWAYRKALGDAGAAHYAPVAFRQAFLLALFAIGAVTLQYMRLLTWWDAALLFVTVLAAEFTVRRTFKA